MESSWASTAQADADALDAEKLEEQLQREIAEEDVRLQMLRASMQKNKLQQPEPRLVRSSVNLVELEQQQRYQSSDLENPGERDQLRHSCSGMDLGPISPTSLPALSIVKEVIASSGQGVQDALGLSKVAAKGSQPQGAWKTRSVGLLLMHMMMEHDTGAS